ncbi:MAG: hypothetical protein J5507_04485 [Clostridia bacterium]|nr:hypothetical protein [Clostridia bacterium]
MNNKEIDKTKIRFNIMAIILIAIFCFAISPVTLQNDTFYTIKIGEHIVQNGIDMQDHFSYHNLQYTYPHWLYDVGIYLIYSIGGMFGIYISTVALAIILGLSIYITNVKLTKNDVTSFLITIGSIYLLKDYIAARAQLVTFILFVLTVYFIEQFLNTKKKRYAIFLVIIPIIIANVHVAVFPFYFVLYLPYIAEYIIYLLSNIKVLIKNIKIKKLNKKLHNINNEDEKQKINNKILGLEESKKIFLENKEKRAQDAYKIKITNNKNVKFLIIIMIVCMLTGFITPLGTTPYTYLVKAMQGTTTKNISEHLPLTLIDNKNYMVVLVLFLAILIFTDTKIRLCDLFMLGGLTFLTFYTKRQESIFIIICAFILNRLVCSLFNKYDSNGPKKIEKKMTSLVGMITTIALVLSISIVNYKPKMDDDFVDESSYPVMASDYILNELDIEKIKLYNEYNYGSYLVFRGIPVFIDSRADLYSPEFNEGVEIFNDFLNISGVNIDNIEEKFDEYGFTHLIMYKDAKLRRFISKMPEKYALLYEDDYFCIYERGDYEI